MNDYYSVAEVETATANLAATYPALARLIHLPNLTAEGRTSRALHLGAPGAAGQPAVMLIAGVHGAEWGSCEIVLNVATDLLAAYSLPSGLTYAGKSFTQGQVATLLDTLNIVVFPLVNPDGRHCSRTVPGREQWRKNRNPDHARGDPLAIGVDVNRNFDFLFDLAAFDPNSGVSGTTKATSSTYQGPWAASEAETRNVCWLLDQFPSTGWFVDIHSPGQSIRYVWGDDEIQHDTPSMNFRNQAYVGQRGLPNDAYGEYMPRGDLAALQGLAGRFQSDLHAVRGTTYAIEPAYLLTPYSGTSHDHAYAQSRGKVLGLFVEWGDLTCQPLWPDMQEIIREVSAGLIGLCIAASSPSGGS